MCTFEDRKKNVASYHKALYYHFCGICDLFTKGEIGKPFIHKDYWEETIKSYTQGDNRLRRLGRRISQSADIKDLEEALLDTIRTYANSTYKVLNVTVDIPVYITKLLEGEKEWSKKK